MFCVHFRKSFPFFSACVSLSHSSSFCTSSPLTLDILLDLRTVVANPVFISTTVYELLTFLKYVFFLGQPLPFNFHVILKIVFLLCQSHQHCHSFWTRQLSQPLPLDFYISPGETPPSLCLFLPCLFPASPIRFYISPGETYPSASVSPASAIRL